MITAQLHLKLHRLAAVVALALAGTVFLPARVLAGEKATAPAVRTAQVLPPERAPGPWRPPLAWPPPLPPPPAARGHDTRLIVLMYHHVGPLSAHPSREEKNLTVSAARFGADLRELRAAGCHCLTMAQGCDLLKRGQLPRHAVCLTFDDGYEDNYAVAWPLMCKYRDVGTFNLVYDSLSAAGHMNREQVKHLAAAGNEMGSHTVSHAVLTRLDDAHLRLELSESKQKLGALLGSPIVTFCYPEGRLNRHSVRAVREAGYRLAMTTEKGGWAAGTPLLEIPRFRMVEQTDLLKCLDGWLSPRRVKPHHRQG